ncbi:hypothetical protein [Pseudomonas sp. COW5]|uniref:hypothetical protein n=1 Tax=Pseudomonas sp. COW5 TaxID=2981253 RepID=UPI0022466C28|nr:hypothetical protein [Pseudomonas sp. COW5]MCX2546568.1 hypothetical protein [Pseudomonas sp. COW5]
MDWGSADSYVSLASGLVGALIGGAFTLKGATKAHELAMEKEKAADKDRTVKTLMLLRIEISAAWQSFREECFDTLLEQQLETPFLEIVPIGASPFPIFDSGQQALTLLPQDLAKDVVHFYMRAKGVIAMIEVNNRDYEEALQHGRALLTKRTEQDREQRKNSIDDEQAQQFLEDVEFMASLLGMPGTADGIRSIGQELEPLVQRITTKVDELFPPASVMQKRTG